MIRQATLADKPQILDMLREYRKSSPLRAHQRVNETTAIQMVDLIITGNRGLILLSEHEGLIQGMVMSIYTFNIWDQTIRYMAELAYWVKPEYRNGTIGYRLLQQYKETGDLLIEQQEIQYYTISKMVNSPDLKYDRFGFDKLEEQWICQPV